MTDDLKTTPVVGFFTAATGLTSITDNHHNELSGNNLKCSNDKKNHELSVLDAASLHQKISFEAGWMKNGVEGLIGPIVGVTSLDDISPLAIACGTKKSQAQSL